MSHLTNTQRCFLGLGSNLDNPIKQLQVAIKFISCLPQTDYVQSASWYQSKAWGVTEQNDFINTVVEIQTTLTPLNLLKAIKVIEYRLMGRQINKKWHARNIDIDILLYGQLRVHRRQLIIPHPLIVERAFVYVPLLELKPFLPFSLKNKFNFSKKLSTDSHGLVPLQQKIRA